MLGTFLRLVAEGTHASQTPFGSILEHQDLQDGDGQLFNQCSFVEVEPIWQSASDAVVRASGDSLIRFLVNRPLAQGTGTLQKTIFYQSELRALSRYPPANGFRVLNEHPEVQCHHIMPLLRERIQQFGLLEGWRHVQTFSCVNVAEASASSPKEVDEKAQEYLKPGFEIREDCKLQSLKDAEMYASCRAEGQLDLDGFRAVVAQFPEDYEPSIESLRLPGLLEKFPHLDLAFHDIMELFNSTLPLELFFWQFSTMKAGLGQRSRVLI